MVTTAAASGPGPTPGPVAVLLVKSAFAPEMAFRVSVVVADLVGSNTEVAVLLTLDAVAVVGALGGRVALTITL